MSNQAGGGYLSSAFSNDAYSLFKRADVDGGCSGGDRKNSFWGKSCVWQTKIMNKRLFVRKFSHFGHKGTGKYIHFSVICSFSQPLEGLK